MGRQFTPSRRGVLRTAGALAAGAMLAPRHKSLAQRRDARRPNIIFILADDLGFECLNCYGGTSYSTPHLDRMAEGGVLYSNAFSTPLCSPSRVEAMTGRYGFRTGWTRLIGRGGDEAMEFFDPARERTFGHVMREAGYRTCVVGKWQLAEFSDHPDHLDQCGFDRHCCWTWKWEGRSRPRYWDPWLWQDRQLRNDLHGRYGEDVIADYVESFIEQSGEQPFFLYYSMMLTHEPFEPTPDSKRAAGSPKTDVRYFGDMVAYMDKLVGRLLATLERLGLLENTLVVFTGDNGTPRNITSRLGNISVPGGKSAMSDNGSHVPLLAHWPGSIQAGQVCGHLMNFCDLLPTFAEVAGAKRPAATLDGMSFLPQLRGEQTSPHREFAFTQLGEQWWIRDQRWKLHSDGRLFDVVSDPWEQQPTTSGQDTGASAAARKRLVAQHEKLRR